MRPNAATGFRPKASSTTSSVLIGLRPVACCALLALHALSFAQDIHFSQFFNVPLALNPALIGQFDGEYRAHGVFRQQWRSVTEPYRTFGAGGDARDFAGIEGLGVGAWLFNDRAGDSRMNQFHFDLGASWTQRFGTTDAHGVTVGGQVGFTSLTIDNGGLSFDAQYNGFHYDPDLDNGESFKRYGLVHPDVHAGLVYRYQPTSRTLIQLGLGLYNITQPGIGFLGGPDVPLDRRQSYHALVCFPIAEKFDLSPMFNHMAQGSFRELDAGVNVRYILLDRYGLKRAVLFGPHLRPADAGYLFAGFEYDDWSIGISYDINTSDLVPASRNRGAIEFTLVRIWKKRPAVPVRFKACPSQL